MSEHGSVRSDVQAGVTVLTQTVDTNDPDVVVQVRDLLRKRVGVDVDDQPALRDVKERYIGHPANCAVKVQPDGSVVGYVDVPDADRSGVLGAIEPEHADVQTGVDAARRYVQAAVDTLHADDPLSREGRAAFKLQNALDALDDTGVDRGLTAAESRAAAHTVENELHHESVDASSEYGQTLRSALDKLDGVEGEETDE